MMKPTVACPGVAPPAFALQSQIDTLKAATALQIGELKAAVAALTAKLTSCGACDHLDVQHDPDANRCNVQCKHNTTTGGQGVLHLEYN
jgi:hypothetical protein